MPRPSDPRPPLHRFLLGGALALALAPAGTTASEPSTLSAPAQELLQWIGRSADHGDRPFVIIDKRQARLWVFDGERRLVSQSPVLLGSAEGDTSAPGIGTKPLSQIAPHERTTPAGRFLLEPGVNTRGEDIIWIDYDAAVSMHRMRSAHAGENRAQRMATATPVDNRISYGCVNVPPAFYDSQLHPRFARGQGYAYVLPEWQSLREAFPTWRPAGGETPPPPRR